MLLDRFLISATAIYLFTTSAHVTNPFEFSLNVFTEFAEFTDKNRSHYNKGARTCHPATSCVRDQDATTSPVRHMWETISLNWAQFMLQWFIRFSATSYVRHQDATTVPARHMWETGSLNSAQFVLQWFISFPEFTEFSKFLLFLEKTLVDRSYRL